MISIENLTIYQLLFSYGWIISSTNACNQHPRTLESITCTCPSGQYDIIYDHKKPQHSKRLQLDISKDHLMATLDEISDNKVSFREEDSKKLDLTFLTRVDMEIISSVKGATINLETDLAFEIYSQQSFNPSYIILRKMSDLKREINISLVSTLNNPNTLARLKYYEGNRIVCEDTSYSATYMGQQSICTETLDSGNSLKYSDSRGHEVYPLNVNSYIIQEIHFNPRGPGAKVHLNRWKFNRFSLKMSKYRLRIEKKCETKSLVSLPSTPQPSKPLSSPSPRTIVKFSPTISVVESRATPSVQPTPKGTAPTPRPKENDWKCGQVRITEEDKEAHNVAMGLEKAALPPPKPTPRDMYGRSGDHLRSDNAEVLTALTPKIVGGAPALPGAWPWQVALRLKGEHQCGGVLLNNYWLLTAQHCFGMHKPAPILRDEAIHLGHTNTKHAKELYGPYTIHMGTIMKSKPYDHEVERKIKEVIPHPNYGVARRHDNDIMLIKLDKPIVYSKYVAPICLPLKHQQNTETLCTVTGFGHVKETGHAEVLKELNLMIVDTEKCEKYLNQRLTSNMFCAGGDFNNDSCTGDSGGPFVCFDVTPSTWTLYGIVSWGIGCGLYRKPGVYTKVANYLEWIQKYIK